MSTASKIARRWKPFALGTLFAAAEAFFINKVSGNDPSWWWWLLLVLTLTGVVGCGVWAWLTPDDVEVVRGGHHVDSELKDGGVATQQSADAHGQIIVVSADNGSFAANKVGTIGNLDIGRPPAEPAGS